MLYLLSGGDNILALEKCTFCSIWFIKMTTNRTPIHVFYPYRNYRDVVFSSMNIYVSIYGSKALVDLGHFFSLLNPMHSR
jgi:hypothetical protein